MSQFDEDVLEAAMDRVRALERLDDPEYLQRLTMDGYHDLLLRAGFPPEEAAEETKRRSWDRISAGVAQ